MTWVKLDDGFAQHPKVLALSLEARWSFVVVLNWCGRYNTDGLIGPDVVPQEHIAEMFKVGLVEAREDKTAWIHDFLDFNPSREAVLADRAAAAERQRKSRERRGLSHAETSNVTDAVTSPHPVPGPVPVPRPVPKNQDQNLSRSALDSAFSKFWTTYPRKSGKVAARKAFERATFRVDPSELLAGAVRLRDDPNREAEFTPHPATWLNGGRWDDDPLPPRSGSNGHRTESTAERLTRIRKAEADARAAEEGTG